MEAIARSLLALKKWFGVLSSICWILFLTALLLSIILHAGGTVMQQVKRNTFEHANGLFAGGFPILFFGAFIYHLPIESSKPLLERLIGTAAKALGFVLAVGFSIAAVAFVLGLLSDPVLSFARWLYHDLWPWGKAISKAFTVVWSSLIVICALVLVRRRSFSLAIEILIEVLKDSAVEIFEFYKEVLSNFQSKGAA